MSVTLREHQRINELYGPHWDRDFKSGDERRRTFALKVGWKSLWNPKGKRPRQRKLASELINKYTKEQLAMACVKLDKDRRHSNQIDMDGYYRHRIYEDFYQQAILNLEDEIKFFKAKNKRLASKLWDSTQARELMHSRMDGYYQTTAEHKMVDVQERIELMHNQLIQLFRPSDTYYQRFKAWLKTLRFERVPVERVILPQPIPVKPAPELVSFDNPEDWEIECDLDDI